MEVIVAGYVEYDALLPAMIASYTASTTSHLLGLEKFSVDVQEIWKIGDVKNAGILVILGLAFGLTGRCFSVLLQKTKKLAGDKISNPLVRIGCLAIPLAVILLALHGARYSGLGTNLITASFTGRDQIDMILFNHFLNCFFSCFDLGFCGRCGRIYNRCIEHFTGLVNNCQLGD